MSGITTLGLPPNPPPNLRGFHPFTVRPRSTSTNILFPWILRPSASLYAAVYRERLSTL